MQPSSSCLPDLTKPFQIESDASDTLIGSALTQEYAFAKLIAFFSNILTSNEKNHSVHNYELLAIVTCCKAWCPYIDGQ